MIDPFGREVSYLRVSVTDRCDFRCVYCMSENMTFLPKADVLSLEELDRLCSAFVRNGVKKLRITGGEPLVRRNIMSPLSVVYGFHIVHVLSNILFAGDVDEVDDSLAINLCIWCDAAIRNPNDLYVPCGVCPDRTDEYK